MSEVSKHTLDWGEKKLIFETGKLAGQANGSCVVRYGDTVILATAVISKQQREGIDYFPLMVDYEEKLYAAGKIKGSRFIKREGRPTDEAVLSGRLIDRAIRPLFDERLRNDVQVTLTILSVDQENDPDVISLIAASAALSISNIPWSGPVVACRIGLVDDQWVLNPTYEIREEQSQADLIVAGKDGQVVMIEGEAKEAAEEKVIQGIEFAKNNWQAIIETINKMQQEIGVEKIKPEEIEHVKQKEDMKSKYNDEIKKAVADDLKKALEIADNHERTEFLENVKDRVGKDYLEKGTSEDELAVIKDIIDTLYKKEVRQYTLAGGQRIDGRKETEIRPLSCEVGLLPRTHGSALFNRGETQALSVVTLGSPGDEQTLDGMEISGKKRYMHHYNFPAFSSGEVAPARSPGRREIGHGALAEKALIPVIPSKEDFPYTIRVVSEILSSNGSTSQASVCGSSLSLMDAGVPIKKPVAGISIGLMTDESSSKYKLLTDIQGMEDHTGDMDFKVAGTKDGITVIQLDIKLSGLDMAIVKQAFTRAKEARLAILDVMAKTIPEPRKEASPYAPRIEIVKINPDKIRELIGPGGKVINEIIDKTEVAIDIEDDGTVFVTSENLDNMKQALELINNIIREAKIGEVFEGTVTQIIKGRNGDDEIGAIVELWPGHDGMVHISQFAHERIRKVSDVVKVGDKLKVKVVDIDKERNRVELSHKVFIERKQRDDQGSSYSGHKDNKSGFIQRIKRHKIPKRGDK